MRKPIENYPNYEVDDRGRIYSLARWNRPYDLELSPSHNNKGYQWVSLYNEFGGRRRLIHRIVAKTFIPNPENKPEVNHIDGNKNNNSVDNLEWVTHLENVQDAIRRGTAYQNISGFDNHRGKKIAQYDLNGNLLKIWPSSRRIEKDLGYAHGNIGRACKMENSKGYGFRWKYWEGVETNADECKRVQ